MMKKIISALIAVVTVVGVWTLLDFLYCTFISRSPFTFSLSSNLIAPVVVSLVVIFVFIPMYNKDMDKAKATYVGDKEIRHHKAPEPDEEK